MHSNCLKQSPSALTLNSRKFSFKRKPSLLPRLSFHSPVIPQLSGVQRWDFHASNHHPFTRSSFLGISVASPLCHHLHQDHSGPRAI